MKKIVIISSLIIVIAGISYFFYSKSKKTEISYSEYTVALGDIELTILATGTVQPKNRLEIKAPVPGRIDKVLIKEGSRVTKGQILAWMSSTERAAMLDAARSKGEAEYTKWSELYLPTPVLAPISGTVILKSVEPGQTFTNVDPIFTMSDHLTVKAQVDETDIAQIKLKSQALIILDAYPNEKIPARVDQLAFDATTTNNVTTYAIDVRPETTPEFMRSGMTANVTFSVMSKKQIPLIPSEAIKVVNGNTIILKKNDNDKSKKLIEMSIKTGLTDGKNTEVTEGLNVGDLILIQDYSLDNGSEKSNNPFSPKFPRGGRNK